MLLYSIYTHEEMFCQDLPIPSVPDTEGRRRRPHEMIRYCAATAQKGKKEEEEKLCFIGKSFPPLIARGKGREKKSFPPPLYCFAESNCCHPGGGEGERE